MGVLREMGEREVVLISRLSNWVESLEVRKTPEKHPYVITGPPPCLAVGIVFVMESDQEVRGFN